MEPEELIKITLLNDYIFCPRSIYFHNLFYDFNEEIYHSHYQKRGKISHKNIETSKYSNRKDILQGISVFSEEIGIIGKIDLYFKKSYELVERKYYIRKIYDGYKYQLYAQFFCLKEMGFVVKKLSLYSLKDNKKYFFNLPSEKDKQFLISLVRKIKNYNLFEKFKQNTNKCKKCIYNNLCDVYENDE